MACWTNSAGLGLEPLDAVARYEFEDLRDSVQALYRAGLYKLAEWLVQQRTGLPYQLIKGQWQLGTGIPHRKILHNNWLPGKTAWRAADRFDEQEQANDALLAYASINVSHSWPKENDAADAYASNCYPSVNPSNGMPMIEGTAIDVTGHVFGTAEF